MTKPKRLRKLPPAPWMSPTGVLEMARAPTEDELGDMQQRLTEWRIANPSAMPPRLWLALSRFVDWHWLEYPWSREQIRWLRWRRVREGIELGMSRKAAYHRAATQSKGSPDQGGVETMGKNFKKVEHSLPANVRQLRSRGAPKRAG